MKILLAGIEWTVIEMPGGIRGSEIAGNVGNAAVIINIKEENILADIDFGDNKRNKIILFSLDGSGHIMFDSYAGLTKVQIKDCEKVLVVLEVLIWQINSGYLK